VDRSRREGASVAICQSSKFESVVDRRPQVMGNDLDVLQDPLSGDAFQPCREPGVQVGALRLRQPVVGGVTDEDVAKPEGIVSAETGAVRPDQLFSGQAEQAPIDGPSFDLG